MIVGRLLGSKADRFVEVTQGPRQVAQPLPDDPTAVVIIRCERAEFYGTAEVGDGLVARAAPPGAAIPSDGIGPVIFWV